MKKQIKTGAIYLLLISVVINLLTPLISAEIQTFGPFFPGDTVNIVQNCLSSTYSNITKLIDPNSVAVLNGQYAMTKVGDNYNYSYILDKGGTWWVYGICDEEAVLTAWQYSIPVGVMELSTTIIYLTLLVGIAILLVLCLTKITSTEDYGWVLGYASLSYIFLISVLFISYKLSVNFLTSIPYISVILYILFFITLILMLPLFLIAVIYLLSKVSSEREINKMIEMGYSADEAKKMRKRK